jgi:hypothetical protein
MLVVTANWAIRDPSLAVGSGSAVDWLREVHRAALRGGFGVDGIYRPSAGIDIVFAGDTFDLLTSATWVGDTRPWLGGRRAHAARDRVLAAALRQASPLLATLSRWTRAGLRVPAADRHGRPMPAVALRAPVRVTLLSGNRDWWLERAGPLAARRGWGVGSVWSADGVVVRHGDEVDPLWFHPDGLVVGPRGTGRHPTLGESIAVDLVTRFADRVLDSTQAGPAARSLVSDLAAVGPLAMPGVVAEWLARGPSTHGPCRSGSLPASRRQRVIDTWMRAVGAWRKAAEAVPPACRLPGCPLDALADVLARACDPEGAAERADSSGLTAWLEALEPRSATTNDGGGTVLGHPGSLPSGDRSGGLVCLGAGRGGLAPTMAATPGPRRYGWRGDHPPRPAPPPPSTVLIRDTTSAAAAWEPLKPTGRWPDRDAPRRRPRAAHAVDDAA